MFQKWCPGIMVLVAVSSASSPTRADDFPPHFSALTLSREQNNALIKLRKDHSSLPPESISPKTELTFFNSCWKVLTDEQQAAWSDEARAQVYVPKEWTELGLSEDQCGLLARPYALYVPRIEQIDKNVRELFESIEEARKKIFVAGVSESEQFKVNTEMADLLWRAQKAKKSREVWATALDTEMRGFFTADQRMRLLVIEAKKLLPKEYATLHLSDDQLAKLAPKLKEIVPVIADLKDMISSEPRQKRNDRAVDVREVLAGWENDLADAMDAVLTDTQRTQLKKTKVTR